MNTMEFYFYLEEQDFTAHAFFHFGSNMHHVHSGPAINWRLFQGVPCLLRLQHLCDSECGIHGDRKLNGI